MFCLLLPTATILYDMNFQILDFYLKGYDDISRVDAMERFCDVWRYNNLIPCMSFKMDKI